MMCFGCSPSECDPTGGKEGSVKAAMDIELGLWFLFLLQAGLVQVGASQSSRRIAPGQCQDEYIALYLGEAFDVC